MLSQLKEIGQKQYTYHRGLFSQIITFLIESVGKIKVY